jgi:hypothetical protein
MIPFSHTSCLSWSNCIAFVFILLPFVFCSFPFDFAASVVREYSSRLRLLLHRAFNAGLAGHFYPCSLPKPLQVLVAL